VDREILEVKEVPEPKLEKPTDAILKVTTASICGSDIHIKHGMMPWIKPGTIIGHEFVGIIEEVGVGVSKFKKGDRVVASGSFQCGQCFYCKKGNTALCEYGGVYGGGDKYGSIGGGQAEYVRIPFADNGLEKIPDGLEDEDVIFVGDILSTGFHGTIMGEIGPGDSVAVFGSGPIGLCAQICARLMGADPVIGVDTIDFRLKIAQTFGSIPINAEKENAIQKIRNLTNGRGADVTIEAGGYEGTFFGSIEAVRRGGTVSILGLFPQPLVFPIQNLCFYTLKICMGLAYISHMATLIKLIEAGRINVRPLITHTFPLSQTLEGYELFENKKDICLKVLLKP
jgi:alcohol dehydrogenase